MTEFLGVKIPLNPWVVCIDFAVILRGQEFVDNFLIKHEFIKRLHARYQKEGITIPFPIRTVYLKAEPNGRLQEERPALEH